ncbi:hypothetical protein TNCV_1207091 [Trichonephila clavipes]|nr:hypothetical protein TNCV_1207091 [Trichonephila clavipes]
MPLPFTISRGPLSFSSYRASFDSRGIFPLFLLFGESFHYPPPMEPPCPELETGSRKKSIVACSAGLSIGCPGSRKGPDKLDLTTFFGYKFRSSCAKRSVDLLRPGPEKSLNRHGLATLVNFLS